MVIPLVLVICANLVMKFKLKIILVVNSDAIRSESNCDTELSGQGLSALPSSLNVMSLDIF